MGTLASQLDLWRVPVNCAKTYRSRGNGRVLRGNAQRFGRSSPVSLAKLGPDGCWLKMYQDCCQVTLGGSLETFSGTWPRAGMMSNGIVYRRQPLAPLTDVIGSLLWPTPRATDTKDPRGKTGGRTDAARYKAGWTLGEKARLFPTPTDASKGGGSSRSGDRINETPTLQGMARKGLWPTPRAQARATCFNREEDYHFNLEEAVGAKTPGQLNPQFVEYLMNFPKGWTDLTE